ncbi:MAG: hypothetical protein JKY45_07095, partial [Emcibacter sp.]|nr:hypothetical protein [Emcibacter sp.]
MTRLWLLVVVGLSLSSGMAFASNAAQEVKKIPDQPYGEYLAGLHAAIHNDLAAAANFHEQALALDPENRMILSKSFTIFIADGRYDLALSAAHKLDEAKASDSIVQMFLFLEDMKSGAYDVSLGRLDNIGSAGVYGLFKPLFQAWVSQSQGKVTEAEANISKMLEDKSFKEFKQFHAGLFYDYIGKTQ